MSIRKDLFEENSKSFSILNFASNIKEKLNLTQM